MITALAFANLILLLILLVVVIMHWMAGRRRTDSAPLDAQFTLIETAVQLQR